MAWVTFWGFVCTCRSVFMCVCVCVRVCVCVCVCKIRNNQTSLIFSVAMITTTTTTETISTAGMSLAEFSVYFRNSDSFLTLFLPSSTTAAPKRWVSSKKKIWRNHMITSLINVILGRLLFLSIGSLMMPLSSPMSYSSQAGHFQWKGTKSISILTFSSVCGLLLAV